MWKGELETQKSDPKYVTSDDIPLVKADVAMQSFFSFPGKKKKIGGWGMNGLAPAEKVCLGLVCKGILPMVHEWAIYFAFRSQEPKKSLSIRGLWTVQDRRASNKIHFRESLRSVKRLIRLTLSEMLSLYLTFLTLILTRISAVT